LRDSLAACSFASGWYRDDLSYAKFLSVITGLDWTEEEIDKSGARIFTLEKMFNYREGFVKEDDTIPPKIFENEFTFGDHKGAIVEKEVFEQNLLAYYEKRGWDVSNSKPKEETLKDLNLEFTIE